MLSVVICIQASIIKVLHLKGSSICAVYWYILGRRELHTKDTSIHSISSWIKNFDTRCFYACNHIQYKLRHINQFFNNISASHCLQYPHLYIYSSHDVFLTLCKLDALILYSFLLMSSWVWWFIPKTCREIMHSCIM